MTQCFREESNFLLRREKKKRAREKKDNARISNALPLRKQSIWRGSYEDWKMKWNKPTCEMEEHSSVWNEVALMRLTRLQSQIICLSFKYITWGFKKRTLKGASMVALLWTVPSFFKNGAIWQLSPVVKTYLLYHSPIGWWHHEEIHFHFLEWFCTPALKALFTRTVK